MTHADFSMRGCKNPSWWNGVPFFPFISPSAIRPVIRNIPFCDIGFPPCNSGMSVNFQQNIRSEGRITGITLLFVFSQEILLTKHDTCRQTTKVIFFLSDRPLFTRPSLYLSLSSFPSVALENNAYCSILNNQQWYTFLLLSSPFLDLPPFYIITAIILL